MYSQIFNKFVTEKWVNRPHISINEKNLQNFDIQNFCPGN